MQSVGTTPLKKKAIVFLLDDSVALAGNCLQARSIQDRENAAIVTDQVVLLKRAGSLVYALAPYAKHVGQEFLREVKLVRSDPVMGRQQPPGDASFYRMESDAGGSLGNMRQAQVRVPLQQAC
jgi:hypothetical protein